MNNIFTDTLAGKYHKRPPVWFMRQAGRVLPSYLKLKEKYTFREMMDDPKLAAEVTLLPVHDLGVDAAILFSDILVIPAAMGMGLEFTARGPVFENPLKGASKPVERLDPQPEKLAYIYDVIDEIIKTRPDNTPLIGFCGAPLTVLLYMVEGISRNHAFGSAVEFIYSKKEETKAIVERITDLSITYATEQVKHGISAFQLFETHAGLIPFELYREIFFPAVKRIASALKQSGTPFIFFPKGMGAGICEISSELCDFFGVDWQTSLEHAREFIPENIGLQGNLDPRLLFSDQKSIERELQKFIPFRKKHPNWIFNFGHGFIPGTPFENAKFVTDWVKNADW